MLVVLQYVLADGNNNQCQTSGGSSKSSYCPTINLLNEACQLSWAAETLRKLLDPESILLVYFRSLTEIRLLCPSMWEG